MKLGQWELNSVNCEHFFAMCRGLPAESVDMILCDLPYGMTDCAWDLAIPLDFMWQEFRRIAKPNSAIVLTCVEPFTSQLVSSNYAMYRHSWVWNKGRAPNFLNANKEPLRMHEDVRVFSLERVNFYPQMRKGKLHRRGGSKKFNNGEVYGARVPVTSLSDEYYPDTLLNFPTIDNAQKVHPTQKPVDLFRYLIRTYSLPGEVVFDPCVGSGTTALAAREERRSYLCSDVSAEYVAVAQKRLDAPYTPNMFATFAEALP